MINFATHQKIPDALFQAKRVEEEEEGGGKEKEEEEKGEGEGGFHLADRKLLSGSERGTP